MIVQSSHFSCFAEDRANRLSVAKTALLWLCAGNSWNIFVRIGTIRSDNIPFFS
jgi:hypothetical protein